MKALRTLTVTKKKQVATITMHFGRALKQELKSASRRKSSLAWEQPDLAAAFMALREDDSVRVIVLTGSEGQFKVPAPRNLYEKGEGRLSHLADPTIAWKVFSSIIRCHQTMAEIEKPIVAKVNGDAIGFGSSIAFASDIIVASEDAMFMDHHMGGIFESTYLGKKLQGGHESSSVPGDGGLALVPLYMTPCKAKEYLMLAQPYAGRELARLGIINYAVPPQDLDRKVNDIVERLLARGAYALAMAKRVANRRVVEHLNMTLDAGVGYEMVSFLQFEKARGKEKKTLD
jgi:enoyl-CoA hydratase/carnithine racemase